MKLTIHPDGTREYDDLTLEDVLRLEGAKTNGVVKPRRKRKPGRPREHVEISELTAIQTQSWQYLTAHDSEEGVHYNDYAKAANLSPAGANDRLYNLTTLGVARKVAPGRYRAGEGK